MSSASRPRASVGSSASKRKSNSRSGGGAADKPSNTNELIVARGLQDILDQEMAKKRASAGGNGSNTGAASGRKKKSGGSPSTGPSFVICYLCGRQFGTASIDIHRPQCYLKKMIEWERGDPALRGPKPTDPETHNKQMEARLSAGGDTAAPVGRNGQSGRGDKLSKQDAYNAAQFDAFQTQALAPCPNCGRTFLPDRLPVHLRSCRPGATARPVPRGHTNGAASHVDASAGVDNGPPVATRLEKSPSPSQPAGARPSSGPAVKAKAVSHRPSSSSHRTPPPPAATTATTTTTATVTAVDAGKAVGNDSDSEIAFMEEVGEEAAPISPSAAATEDKEEETEETRRHSIAGEPGGTSTPTRYASMEPGADDAEPADDRKLECYNYIAAERQASAEAVGGIAHELEEPPEHNTRDAASAVNAACANNAANNRRDSNGVEGGPQNNRRGSGLSSREEHTRRNSGAAAVESGANSRRGSAGPDTEDEDGGKRKIPLNNVSRFKNVQSRLKMELKQQDISLTPCKFCGRTFNPARIAKHESCCLERNKAPAPAVNRTRKSAAPAPNNSAKRPTSVAATRFCGDCGAEVAKSDQKFCSSCGARRSE